MNAIKKNRFIHFTIILIIGSLLSACSEPYTETQPTYNIYAKIAEYKKLSEQPWPAIDVKTPLEIGMQNTRIPEIRQRLYLLKDLSHMPDFSYYNKDQKYYFGQALFDAIRHFQSRHGIASTGILDRNTLKALNVTPAKRLAQILHSIERWNKLPNGMGSHYVHVNVPSFDLNVIKEGERVLSMKVVTGSPYRTTPELYSWIKSVVFNPTWTVPKSIIRRDIIPKLLKNPKLLPYENMKIYSAKNNYRSSIDPANINWRKAWRYGSSFRFVQSPGDNNALGRVKFIFPNNSRIYLHDTPQKSLFGLLSRAYSSGCIRLEKPLELAQYILQDEPGYDYQESESHDESTKTRTIHLKKPIPIYITYITAWVGANGHVHFREDIYRRIKAVKN